MAFQSPDFPIRDPLVGPQGLITDPWRIWLRNLHQEVGTNPARVAIVTLDAQTGSLATTPYKTASLGPGLYRVNVFTHVTTVGSVSSSLSVTIGFTHKTVACTFQSIALVTNLTTSVQTNVWTFAIDASTPVTYASSYAANAAASMAYSFVAVLESVNA